MPSVSLFPGSRRTRPSSSAARRRDAPDFLCTTRPVGRYLIAMNHEHTYRAVLAWEGNLGEGTSSYQGYSRKWTAKIEGKPDLAGTADPAFRGEADKHNPEDLLVASLSSCHMLTYLALCARNKISVVSYVDEATGVMKTTPDGGGKVESGTLHPPGEI